MEMFKYRTHYSAPYRRVVSTMAWYTMTLGGLSAVHLFVNVGVRGDDIAQVAELNSKIKYYLNLMEQSSHDVGGCPVWIQTKSYKQRHRHSTTLCFHSFSK